MKYAAAEGGRDDGQEKGDGGQGTPMESEGEGCCTLSRMCAYVFQCNARNIHLPLCCAHLSAYELHVCLS